MMRLRIRPCVRTVIVLVSLVVVGVVAAEAQGDCPECQPLAERLRTLENELMEAEGRVNALRQLLDELQASNTQIGRAEIPKLKAQFDEAFERADMLSVMVMQQSVLLRQCQRNCRRRQQRPHRPGDLVDESIPRPACKPCEPIVVQIKELQRLRRIARDELKEADQRLADHDLQTNPGFHWFEEGIGLVIEHAAASEAVDELTAQIARALDELTACNWRCSGKEPPPTLTTGSVTPIPVPPPPRVVCRPCDDAARALAKAEQELATAQRELEQDELANGSRKTRYEMDLKALKELQAQGQGRSAEAIRLDWATKFDEERAKILDPDGDGTTKFAEALRSKIEQTTKRIHELKQKLDDCEKECKTKETSSTFPRPLLFGVGGGAVLAGALIAGGGDSPVAPTATPSSPTGNQLPSPAPSPNPDPTPAPPDCSQRSGTYSITSVLRMPANCTLPGGRSVFPSSMTNTFILQFTSACTGTLTTRYTNGWTFPYNVRGTFNGMALQIVSTSAFMSTQVFGVSTASTIEVTINDSSATGAETHMASSCTDIYTLQGNKQ